MNEQEHDSVLHFMLMIRLYNTISNFANALQCLFFFVQENAIKSRSIARVSKEIRFWNTHCENIIIGIKATLYKHFLIYIH